ELDGIAGTASSDDGGSSWVYEGQGDSHGSFRDIAPPRGVTNLDVWAAVDYLPPLGSRRADLYVSYDGADWGLYWNPPPGGAVFDPGNGVRAYDFALRVLTIEDSKFAIIHQGGRVSIGRMVPSVLTEFVSFGTTLEQYTNLIEGGDTTTIYDAAYDTAGQVVIVTGEFARDGGDVEPRVWSSTDGCKTWKRLLEVEAALVTPATVVTVDDEGNAWYF